MFELRQTETNLDEIALIGNQAYQAFQAYKLLPSQQRATFLRAIAQEIEAITEILIDVVHEETHLSETRIRAELQRTIGHCLLFAAYIEKGNETDVIMESGDANRKPSPKPELRRMLIPIGPIAVFGAANFPLAYSTPGGDTISALAAGCAVIVKAHPAHPQTCYIVAEAIERAALSAAVPTYTFQQIYGGSHAIGAALVTHPKVKGVGFTGSFSGGKSLYDLVQTRSEPIPFFAEMSSINPVILLPEALEKRALAISTALIQSLTNDMGQFCTCPGLLLTLEGAGQKQLVTHLAAQLSEIKPAKMLHNGIADNYRNQVQILSHHPKVKIIAKGGNETHPLEGQPTIAQVRAIDFMEDSAFVEEVFGPFSLLINCQNQAEMLQVIQSIPGQLTMSIHADSHDRPIVEELLPFITEKAGRIVFNGVPTGVEVAAAQVHGGPFPASTDSRFTAVGSESIKRFMRPIAFQNFPDDLLPDVLKRN